jgi:hypothetical protein
MVEMVLWCSTIYRLLDWSIGILLIVDYQKTSLIISLNVSSSVDEELAYEAFIPAYNNQTQSSS